MASTPLAIHGYGLIPALLAVHLLNQDPARSLLLLTRDREFGGLHLEAVVANKLSPVAAKLIDPFVVSIWPGYYVVSGGVPQLHHDQVLLLDPVQVWLELQLRLPQSALISQCGPIEYDGAVLQWTGGSAAIDRMIDLEPLLGPECSSSSVGLEAVRQLKLPILADYDEGCKVWAARQFLPLGDERMVMRNLPHAGQQGGLRVSFEALLNGLTDA